MADKFKRYGIPVRLENTPIFKKIFADIEKFLDAKVTKRKSTSTVKYVYAYDNAGDTEIIVSNSAATPNAIVQRTASGRIWCTSPLSPEHAATKQYVDDAIAALKAELTQ